MLGAMLTRTTASDAASAPVASIEFKAVQKTVSNYSRISLSVEYDTLGLVDGEVVVVSVTCDYTNDNIIRSSGHPGGSELYNDTSVSGRPRTRVDVITYSSASWPATLDYETSAGDSEDWVAHVSRWQNVDSVDIVDDFGGSYQSATLNPSSPALTATESSLVAVAIYGAQEDDIDASGYPSGYTGIAIDYSVLWGGACSGGQAYKTGISAGAVAAASWTQSVATACHGVHLLLRPAETGSATVSVGISGTTTPSIGDTDIVAGGKTVIWNLTNDTFAAAGTGPIGSTADSQALIDSLTSAQSEATGWNAEVRDKELVANLVRTSDNVATLTLQAAASYAITAIETIESTVPAAVLVTSGSDVVAVPTFNVATSSGYLMNAHFNDRSAGDTLSNANIESWFGVDNNRAGIVNGTIDFVSDPAAGGSREIVMRVYQQAGVYTNNGVSGGSWRSWTDLMGGALSYDELYFAFDVYLEPGKTWNKGQKFPGLMGGDWSELFSNLTGEKFTTRYMLYGSEATGIPDTDGTLLSYDYDFLKSQKARWCDDGPGGQVYLEQGTWYRIEKYIKLNDLGSANGIGKTWLDGVLVQDSSNITWRPSTAGTSTPDIKLDGIYWSFQHGGGDSSWAPVDDRYTYFDNFILSTSRIYP